MISVWKQVLLLLVCCYCCFQPETVCAACAVEDGSIRVAAQASLLADLVPADVQPDGPGSSRGSSLPRDFTVLHDDSLYFRAFAPNGLSLWRVASYDDDSSPVQVEHEGVVVQQLVQLPATNRTIVFGRDALYELGSNDDLQVIDGYTGANDEDDVLGGITDLLFMVWQERMVHFLVTERNTLQLWKTDGSTAELVGPLNIRVYNWRIAASQAMSRDYLLLRAEVGVFQNTRNVLLYTDGTTAPQPIPPLANLCLTDINEDAVVNNNGRNNLLVILCDDDPGSSATTNTLAMIDLAAPVSDWTVASLIPKVCRISSIIPLEDASAALVFLECGPLWVTDGTVEGTRQIHASLCTQIDCRTSAMTHVSLKGTTYFSGGKGSVYRSDGTSEGTTELQQIPDDHRVTHMTVSRDGNTLYFVVINMNDDDVESELWVSNGASCTFVQPIAWSGNSDRVDNLNLIGRSNALVPFHDGLVFTTDFGKTIYNIEPRVLRPVAAFDADESLIGSSSSSNGVAAPSQSTTVSMVRPRLSLPLLTLLLVGGTL